MFTQTPSSELLQGDLAAVEALPVWQLKATGVTRDGDEQILSVQLPLARTVPVPDNGGRLVMVCSHSCDIENPRSRSGLLVAPVIKVPASEQKEGSKWQEITSSHSPDEKHRWSYSHLFPVELPDHLGGHWAVVDFSSLISMGKAAEAAEVLGGAKLAQLSDDFRVKLQTKLAVFVGAPDRANST